MPARKSSKTAKLFRGCLQKCLKIPEKLTVSQWAEKYRDLGETSSLSGKWSNEMTPYLVDIMDSFSNPYIQEINFCKPTQVGGTEAMNNMLGYAITQDPAQTMIVYPTDDLAKDTSKDRLIPSLTQTKEIKESYNANLSKQMALKFKGMNLYITGAGNPTKLASKAIRYLFFDEIDKLDGASKKEASPYNLARERTRTYPYTKKIYTCSTPTLRTNYVWQLHEKAEVQKEFYVPCPHCGEFAILDFHQIIFDNGDDKTPEERAETAKYICKTCGCEITDREKMKAVRLGEWRAVKGEHITHPRTVSFHMNCLPSRFLSWKDIALEFLKSKDNPDELQNFVNSWLAEPWEDTRMKTTAEMVLERQTDIPEFVVPEWAKMLTAGVDVQETSVYWSIRAWGNFITSQCIAHGQQLSFNELVEIMNRPYYKANGEQFIVALCLVDSGDQTDMVYDFCYHNQEWAKPSKGSSTAMLSDYKISKINKIGSSYGMQLVIVDTGKYKDMIASRMAKPNGKGSWMVFQGCDEEYAKQVTAEHKINVKNGSKVERKWVQKHSHGDNHYLDCEVYALCAADMLGVRGLYLEDETATPKQNQPVRQPVPEEDWINSNENWV